eukprot:5944303-Amphidinium_carterae.1
MLATDLHCCKVTVECCCSGNSMPVSIENYQPQIYVSDLLESDSDHQSLGSGGFMGLTKAPKSALQQHATKDGQGSLTTINESSKKQTTQDIL